MSSKQVLKEQCDQLGVEYQDIISKDPSSTKKYVKWIITQVANGSTLTDIIPTIEYFHTNNIKFQQRDINQYGSFKELEDKVKEISFKKSNRKKRQELKEDVPKIFEDENYLIVRIMDNKEAAVYYGKNTQWCITMEDANHFENYMAENTVFYYIIKRKPAGNDHPFDKVCLAVERDADNNITGTTYFNAQDKTVSEEEVYANFPGLKEAADKEADKQAQVAAE